MEDNTNNGGNFWGWVLGGFLVIVLLVGVFWVFNPQWNNNSSTANQIPQGGAGLLQPTLSDIIANPTKYLEATVVVDGTLGTLYTDRIFTLGGTASDSGVLVISKRPIPYPTDSTGASNPPKSGQNIRVEGTVKKLSVVQITKQLNINLDPQVTLKYDGKPIIVAERIILQ